MTENEADALYKQAQGFALAADATRLKEAVIALHRLEPWGWRPLLAASALAELDDNLPMALDLGRDAVEAAFYRREDDSPDALRHALGRTLDFVLRRSLHDEADSLVEWAFRLRLLYPEVLQYARRAYGRPSANARCYRVTVEGRVQEPDLISEFRETQPDYTGDYGYRCDLEVWAEHAAEAESLVLAFEHEYGPGGDLRIARRDDPDDSRNEPCGVASRSPMHVYRLEP